MSDYSLKTLLFCSYEEKHCLKETKLGKVNDLYFLSFSFKNGTKNHNFSEVALRCTNPMFPQYNNTKQAKYTAIALQR